MRYQTLLFDLDGTLTTSWQGIYASIRHALEEMDWPEHPCDDVLRPFVGPPLRDSFRIALGMEEDEVDRAVTAFRAHYGELGYRMNAVFTGIPALLSALRGQGARLYVATNKLESMAQRVLDHLDLARYFDGVCGPTADNSGMTKAQVIGKALSLAGDAGPAVMIGDRASDIAGAQENGIDSIGVGFGFGDEAELRGAGPTHYAPDMADLSEVLLGAYTPAPGFFITVEGIDGSGKSTHLPRIGEFLEERGYEVVRTREPGGDFVAEQIRDVLLDPGNEGMRPETEALLYAASRAQHVREVIRPALAAGKVVLCDRFLDSSMAYQGAGRGLGMERVAQINEMAMDGIRPDLTLLFSLDSRIAGQRLSMSGLADRIEREPLTFFERVSEAYLQLQRREPDRIKLVDAGGTMEQTYAQAESILDALLRSRG